MKKSIAWILAVLFVLTMTGCAAKKNEKEPKQTAASEKPAEATNAPETPTPEPTEAPTPEPTAAPAAFEHVVLFDTENYYAEITGFEKDEIWGWCLKIYMENRMAERNIVFSVDGASVNGVSWDPFFGIKVEAGKKANEKISFFGEEMQARIPEFTDVAFSMRIYDYDDYFADDLDYTTVHVYPYGEANATTYEREPQPGDLVLIDNDAFSVIVTGYDPEGFWGYTVNLYLENKTDQRITIAARDSFVNDFKLIPYWSETVEPHTVAFSGLSWSKNDFEENGITGVEKIELTFYAYDAKTWDEFYSETFTLNP